MKGIKAIANGGHGTDLVKKRETDDFTRTHEGLDKVKLESMKNILEGKSTYEEEISKLPRWMRRTHKKLQQQGRIR